MGTTIIPLAGIAIPLILVPTILLLKHSRLKRQWAHLERMEAIKRGSPASAAPSLPGAGTVVALGAGVPAAAVAGALFATLAVLQYPWKDPLWPLAIIWGSAFLISALGLTVALILGLLQHRASARAAERASTKPAYDPDGFDVAGRHAY